MNKQNLLLLTAALLLMIGTVGCHSSKQQVELNQVTINISSNKEAKNAVGILITNKGTRQIPTAIVEPAKNGLQTVTFSYTPKKGSGEVFASAAIISKEGEYIFGDVKRIKARKSNGSFVNIPESSTSHYNIPTCPDAQPNSALQSQVAAIESLIDLRTKRRLNRDAVLKKRLSGEFLEKLARYEEGFGLDNPLELSAALTPFELTDRLSRLAHVITVFKSNRTATN